MTNRNRLTTVNDHHHHQEQEEDEEVIGMRSALIFDASYSGEIVPDQFDAVRIFLDGKIQANLSWKEEQKAAEAYIKQGLRIFWEIDLGLPASLPHALSNRTQFLSLSLSLEHFRDTLWRKFRKETVGVCLYRGSLDLSLNYPWDDEQELNLQEWLKDYVEDIESLSKVTHIEALDFASLTSAKLSTSRIGRDLLRLFAHDVIGEYLGLLASNIPDNLPLFLLFDASHIQDAFLVIQLLSKERYPRFIIGVKHDTRCKGNQFLGGEVSWNDIPTERGCIAREIPARYLFDKPKLGYCLPQMSQCRLSSATELKHALHVLLSYKIPFRVIPELELSAEWEGLDYLIVDTQLVEIQFKRRLQGFCAAGGTIVTLGHPLGFSQEISFDQFLSGMGMF